MGPGLPAAPHDVPGPSSDDVERFLLAARCWTPAPWQIGLYGQLLADQAAGRTELRLVIGRRGSRLVAMTPDDAERYDERNRAHRSLQKVKP